MAYEGDVPWLLPRARFRGVAREFPPPPDYFRDGVSHLARRIARAPGAAVPGDRATRLGDSVFPAPLGRGGPGRPATSVASTICTKLPPYTVKEIRESIERNPPFGDFMGVSPADGTRMPLVLQTSGGTTGLPRPMLYAPRDRETMAILGGRRFALHGVRPGDLVMVTYSLGLGNGGIGAARGDMALYRRGAGDDRQRRHHADAPPDRDRQGVGRQRRSWVSVLLAPHGARGPGRNGHRSRTSLGIRLLGSHLGQEDREAHRGTVECALPRRVRHARERHDGGRMRRAARACTSRRMPTYSRSPTPRRARMLADGEKGAVLYHHALSVGRAADPLQRQRHLAHHSRAVRVRRHASAPRAHLRPQRHMVKLRGVNVFPEAVGAVVVGRPAHQWRVFLHRRARRCRRPRGDDSAGGSARLPRPIARDAAATSSGASRRCSACG